MQGPKQRPTCLHRIAPEKGAQTGARPYSKSYNAIYNKGAVLERKGRVLGCDDQLVCRESDVVPAQTRLADTFC